MGERVEVREREWGRVRVERGSGGRVDGRERELRWGRGSRETGERVEGREREQRSSRGLRERRSSRGSIERGVEGSRVKRESRGKVAASEGRGKERKCKWHKLLGKQNRQEQREVRKGRKSSLRVAKSPECTGLTPDSDSSVDYVAHLEQPLADIGVAGGDSNAKRGGSNAPTLQKGVAAGEGEAAAMEEGATDVNEAERKEMEKEQQQLALLEEMLLQQEVAESGGEMPSRVRHGALPPAAHDRAAETKCGTDATICSDMPGC
eukprot:1355607-Rhodomonas_salina.2